MNDQESDDDDVTSYYYYDNRLVKPYQKHAVRKPVYCLKLYHLTSEIHAVLHRSLLL